MFHMLDPWITTVIYYYNVPYPLKWKGSNLCGQYLMIVRFVLDPSCAYHSYIRNYDNDVIELWIDKLKTIKTTYLS